MKRIVIAAAVAAALSAGQAWAQAPAIELSANAQDLKRACAAQVEAAIAIDMTPAGGGMDRAAATHDVEGALQQTASAPKDQIQRALQSVQSSTTPAPQAYKDFAVCIFTRRLAQP